MYDIMNSLGYECDIHTFDINEERVSLPEKSSVNFHLLDNKKIRQYVSEKANFFENLVGPILVIEDSHVNRAELINCIDPFLNSGDYLVVEDTLDFAKYNETIASNECLGSLSYQIDTRYCDFWGTNNSWNINSILRKA